MLKRLLTLLLILTAGPALADINVVPSDITYTAVTPTYAAGTTLNVVNTTESTNELTEVNPVSKTGWVISNSSDACLTTFEGGTCAEAKVRFTFSGYTHMLRDDPIRNARQPGTSHLHCFWGNPSVNAYSTYSTLRSHALKSTASGGALNATGYWMPCMTKEIGGQRYAIRNEGTIIIYYEMAPSQADETTYLPIGLRYVSGYNMDDGDAYMQGLVDTANAQPGTSGRYSLTNLGSREDGWHIWKCSHAGTEYSSGQMGALTKADGTDTFEGNCQAGDDLWVQFKGPTCFSGQLWSPGGYKNVIPRIWDNVADEWVCPNGWRKVVALQGQVHFKHNGPSDYMTWLLSSDIDKGVTRPGLTFHTDWFNGWQRSVLRGWLEYCIGVLNALPSRECNSSRVSATESLITSQTAPTGRSPQVQGTDSSSTDVTKMWKIPDQPNGPKTLHIHGG